MVDALVGIEMGAHSSPAWCPLLLSRKSTKGFHSTLWVPWGTVWKPLAMDHAWRLELRRSRSKIWVLVCVIVGKWLNLSLIFCIQTKNMNAHLRVAVRLVLKFLKSYSFLVMSHLRVVCRCISVISWLSIHFSLVFGLVDATTSAFQIFCHSCLLENGPG